MADRKQSLRALVRSRGFEWYQTRRLIRGQMHATVHGPDAITVRAPTRRAVLAGLRAVLESLPAVKGPRP